MNTGSQPPMTNARRRWVLLATVLGSAVVFLDGTVVNIALPTIGRDLPSRLVTTLEGQTYVYNVYLLSLSSLLLLAGSVSDRFGRRRTLIWGLVGFGMASLLCGIAPNIELLITFRFLQGAAGALLVPGSLALLREAFPTGPEQGRAFGRWASGTAVAILAGPLIGGILVDLASWRWVFLINIPVIAAALVAAGRGVARDGAPKGGNEGRLDWLNAGISVVAIGGITTSIIYGQAHNWQTVWVWPLLLGGLLAAGVLPFSLRRSTHPLVPLELFKSRDFVAVNLGTLVIYGALYVNAYYLPLFLQGTLGYTAAAAGILSLPGSIFVIVLSPRAGALVARVGPRPLLTLGPLLMAVALMWFARVPAGSQPWTLNLGHPASYLPPPSYWVDILPGTVLFGLGISTLVSPLTATLMGSVPPEHGGVASAFNNAVSRVGPQLAGSAVFVAVSATFFSQLGRHPAGLSPLNRPVDPALVSEAAGASVTAFHLAMGICVGMLLVGALIALFGLNSRPRS